MTGIDELLELIQDTDNEITEIQGDTTVHVDTPEKAVVTTTNTEFPHGTPLSLSNMDITLNTLQGDSYCPVDSYRNSHGGIDHVSYLVGQVDTIDKYTKLIDVLVTMNPDDRCFIMIDSMGGYISTGSQIASAIHHCKGTVITKSIGFTASAAALIHSAANKENQFASDFAVLMYHSSSSAMPYGYTVNQVASGEVQIQYVNDSLLSKAREDGSITDEEFNKIQTGTEIFITGAEFTRRKAGEQPIDINKDAETATVAGTEAFGQMMYRLENTKLEQQQAQRKLVLTHHVFTKDGKNFRLYLPQDQQWTPNAIRTICRFIDKLTEDMTLTIFGGSDGDDGSSYLVTSIISSIQSCKAKTVAIASGPMSVAETIIWCFADERILQRYGYLRFSVNSEFTKLRTAWIYYYDKFLQRGKELKLLTDETIASIKTGKDKVIMYNDLKALGLSENIN